MSDASADEAANTPDVPGPLTNLQLQHQPIEEIHGEASFVDGGEDACAVAKATASVPPTVSTTSNPTDPVEGEFTRMFGSLKSLGVPTTDVATREGGGGKERNEEQEKEKKKDLGGSAVSRLRQMFERNNSDSKKTASLQARPLPRRIAAVAVSSIGKHEVIEETVAVVAQASVDAAEEPAALDAAAGVQVPAAGTNAVGIAGGGPVAATVAAVPEPVSDAIETAAGQRVTTIAPVPGAGIEGSTYLLSLGSSTLVPDLSFSASPADQMTDDEPDEVAGAAAAADVEQAVGDEASVTLDGVQTEIEPVMLEADVETEQRVSTSEGLVAEEGVVVSAAATDDESGAGKATPVSIESAGEDVEQTAEELASDDMAPAEVDSANPAGASEAVPSESAGGVESVTIQHPPSVVDQVPEVETAASIVEDPSANAATDDSPIEQLIESAAADDAMVDTGPEAGADQPVPVTDAPVGGDMMLAAAVEQIDDEVDEELNVAGAGLVSRVEERRQMFDQKSSRADEETADGEVAGVVEDKGGPQAEEGNVVQETVVAAEQLPTTPAARGDSPVVAMPLPTAEGPSKDEQRGTIEEESASGGGGTAVAAAVLDKAEPSAIADQLSETANQAPIATAEDVIEVDSASVRPDAVSMTDDGSKKRTQVAEPSCAVPVPVQDTAPEVSKDLAAATPGVALLAPVDGCTREQKSGEGGVKMAGAPSPAVATVGAVPDAVSDAIEGMIDQPALIDTPLSGVGVEESTSSLSAGVASAGDDVSATMDGAHAEAERVTLGAEAEPERPVSASMAFLEDGVGVPAAATDGVSTASEAIPVFTESASVEVEQTVEEVVSDDAPPAEKDMARPAGTDTAGSSEGAGSVEPFTTPLSSVVVGQVPEVEAAAMKVEDSSANEATGDSPIAKLVESAGADDAVVDAGPETKPEQPVPVVHAAVGGDVMLVAAVESKHDEVDEEPNVSGAAPLSQSEDLRRMFDQKASRANEETADGDVAGITQDEVALQTEEGDVVHETAFAVEPLPVTPAAVGDISGAAMPLSLAAGAGEGDQPGAFGGGGSAPGIGDEAVAVAVLDAADPWEAALQLPEVEAVDQAPVGTVDGVIEEDAGPVRPEPLSVSEASPENGAPVAEPWVAMPATVQDSAPEVPQDLAAAGSDEALLASVDGDATDAVGGAVDGERSDEENQDDKEATMAGEGPVSDAIEEVTGEPAPTVVPVSGGDGEGSSSPLPMGATTLVQSLSSPVCPGDHMPDMDPVSSLEASAAVEHLTGDEVPVTLNDVRVEVERVTPEAGTKSEHPGLAGEALVQEDAVVSAVATDGESGAGGVMPPLTEVAGVQVEQAAGELGRYDTVLAEVDTASPAGDDTADSSDCAGSVEPVATQTTSLVVEGVPEVEAATSIVEDPSTTAATGDSTISQLVASAAVDDAVVDAGPETGPEHPVPVIHAAVGGDVMLVAAVKISEDEVDEEPNVSGAAPLSRSEDLRQMFDQKASRADEETADGDVAGIAQDEVALQREAGDVAHETASATEQLPSAPAVVGDTPMAAILLPPAEEGREEGQAGALEGEEDAPDRVNLAVQGAVLDTADPTKVENQPPEAEMADVAPIANVDDVIGVDAVSATPDYDSMAEVRTDDRVQVAGPSAAMPVAVLDVALEVSQDVAATRSDEARPGSVDVVVANFVDGAADGERAEKANSDDEEVTMVGGVPAAATASAVPPAVSDAIESDSSVEEEDAGVPAADTDDESGAGEAMTVSTESTGADVEQTVKRLVADDMAPAEIDSGSPAGDGTAWSSEGAETVEPVASQLSSSIVDKVSEVEAAASITEDPSANAATEDAPIEQLVGNTAADDAMADDGPETDPEQPVPVTEASAEGDVVLAAAVEWKDDQVDEELNVADTAQLSRVENLRQMFGQKASCADEETADGDAAGLADDKDALQTDEVVDTGVVLVDQDVVQLQTDEGEVVENECGAPATHAAAGNIPVSAIPLSPAEDIGENDQPSVLETVVGASNAGGRIAVAGAVLDTAELSSVADQLPEMATTDQSPIATVDGVIEEHASSVTPDTVSMAEAGSGDGAQVAGSLKDTPVAVPAGAAEVSQNLAATGSDAAPTVSVDDVANDTAVDHAVDGGQADQEKTDDKEVEMAGEGVAVAAAAVVPDGFPDMITTATDQVATIGTLVSGMNVEDSTPSLSAVVATAGDQAQVTLDDVRAEVALVTPEEETEPERPGSASDSSVEERDAGLSATAVDGACGAGEATPVSIESACVGVEQTVEELAGDDTAPAEVDSARPAGDGTAWSSEGAETVEPVASQLSSLVVDDVPEVEAAASIPEKTSANAAMEDAPIDQLVGNAAADDAVVDAGPETDPEHPIPVTETSAKGEVVLAAAVERIVDEADEELNVADTAQLSRVENLRQMFDQKASCAGEEVADGHVAGVAQDFGQLQTDEGEVVEEETLAAEPLPNAPAAVGGVRVADIPLSPTEGPEDEQLSVLETGVGASNDGGDVAVAGAVLDTAKLSSVADQIPGMATADQSPIATIDDVIEANVSSMTPDTASMAEVGSGEGAQVAIPLEAMSVEVQNGALDISQDLTATESDGVLLPASANFAVADTVDYAVDVRQAQQEKAEDREVETAGEGVGVATVAAVPDAIDTATDQLTPIGASVPDTDVGCSTPSLSAGFAAAGDQVSATLDDVWAEDAPVTREEEAVPERPGSAGDGSVEEGDSAGPGAAIDGESVASEAMPALTESAGVDVEQAARVSDDTAIAEVDMVSPAGDRTAWSSEGAENADPASSQLPSLVMHEAPEVEGAASNAKNPSANAAMDDSSIEQLVVNAVADEEVGNAGPGTEPEQPVPVIDALVEEGATLAAMGERKDDEVDEELNMSDAAPLSRVEELRQMFDQKSSRADEIGEVAAVAQDKEAIQTEEVAQESAPAAEYLSTAADGDIPVAAMPLSPAEGAGTDEQPVALEREEDPTGGNGEAVAGPVLDTAKPSVVVDQLAEGEPVNQVPIAMVDDVIEVGTAPAMPDAASMAELRSEDGLQVADPWVALPPAVQDGAPEVSQGLAAAGSDEALPAFMDGDVTDAADSAVDGERREQHDKEVTMAGGGAVAATVAAVHEPLSDTIETVADELPRTSAPVSGAGIEGRISLPSAVSAILVPDLSSSASMADQMSGGEPAEVVGAVAAAVEQAAEDQESGTVNDVQAEVKPVALEGETEPEQPVSASEALGENNAVPPAAATDGVSGAGEVMPVSTGSAGVEARQTMEALASDDAAPAEATITTVDDAIEDVLLAVRPDAVSMSEACSDEGAQTAEPWVVVPVPVQDTTQKGSQELAATGPDGELTAPIDAADTDTFDGAVDDERAELDKDDDEDVEDVKMAGADAVADAVPDTIEAGTDRLAPPAAPVLGEGGDDSTSRESVDSSALVHGVSADATAVVDQMSDGELVEVARVTAAADIQQAAGDEMSATLDNVPAEVVVIVGETEPEQRISASEALAENGAVVPAVAADGESGAAISAKAGVEAEQTVGERVSDDTTAARLPIATVDDVIEDDTESATVGTSSAIDIRSEDWIRAVGPSVTVPAPVQDTAPEGPQELTATGPNGELPAPVDAAADTVDGVLDDERPEQDKEDDEDVKMAGAGPVNAVPDAVSDAIEAVTDQLAPTAAPFSGDGVEGNTLPLSADTTLADGMSSDATMVDQMSHGEPVETVGAAAVGKQAAGDEVSATPDDVHAEIEPVALEEDTEPEQRVSASEALVEEESAVIPAAAPGAHGESNSGAVGPVSIDSAGAQSDQMVEGLMRGDTAPAEAFIASSKGDETAGLSGSAEGVESGEIHLSTLTVDELPKVEPGEAISGDPEVKADTAGSPIDQIGESAVFDADLGTEPEQPVQAAKAVAEGGVVDAAEDMNAVERMPTSTESAGAEVEEPELAAANELMSGDTTPADSDTLPPGVNSEKDGSVESAEIVELSDAQPIAGDALADAGPETEHEQPDPESEAVVDGGVLVSPAALGADEESCVSDTALTPTDSAGVEVEQAEVVTVVELAVGSTAPAMLDAEAPAPVPGGSRTPATGGLVSADVAVESTALHGDGQPFAEKRQNAFEFLPKLLGWDKEDKLHSRVARIESAAQAAGGQEAAARPLVSPAAGVLEGKESAAQGGKKALEDQASTVDNDAALADLPPSGVEETSASAGVNVCGITETGMADTTAAFGVVDLSALMAEETAGHASPNLEPPAPPANFRGPQRSLSPGWKGYANADAPSESPETAGVLHGVDQAGVSLQALPGGAEGRAGAGDPYASPPPDSLTLNERSPNKKDCVIS